MWAKMKHCLAQRKASMTADKARRCGGGESAGGRGIYLAPMWHLVSWCISQCPVASTAVLVAALSGCVVLEPEPVVLPDIGPGADWRGLDVCTEVKKHVVSPCAWRVVRHAWPLADWDIKQFKHAEYAHNHEAQYCNVAWEIIKDDASYNLGSNRLTLYDRLYRNCISTIGK